MSAPNTPVVVARDGPVSPPRGTTGLRAITVPLGSEPVDLVEVAGQQGIFWQHDGAGLAGRGVAATIDLDNGLGSATAPTSTATTAAGPTTGRPTAGGPTAGGPTAAATVMAALAQIATDDPLGWSGTGPVALGALPFDRSAPATLVIPSVLVGRDREGRQWLTLVAPEDVSFELDTRGAEELVGDLIGAAGGHAGGPGRSPQAGKVWSPDQFTLISPRTHEEWCDVVRRATEAIQRGEFRKVVLAREIMVEANRPFVLGDVLRRLLVLHPACMVFAMDGFVGASPELLVGRHGRTVRSHPLAGTISRSGDIDTDAALAAALLASPKDRREHGLVVDAVAHALEPFCDRLDVPGEPSIVALRNVAHLGTSVMGDLRPTAPASALELVDALHPTPAVGGTPAEAALAFLERHEGLARERYAGPVGWMDRRGDGEWAVAIRSAEIDANRARLFAGVGVVAGSDPEAELAETQLKLQALLAALVRP